jgi:hypothetical protein
MNALLAVFILFCCVVGFGLFDRGNVWVLFLFVLVAGAALQIGYMGRLAYEVFRH